MGKMRWAVAFCRKKAGYSAVGREHSPGSRVCRRGNEKLPVRPGTSTSRQLPAFMDSRRQALPLKRSPKRWHKILMFPTLCGANAGMPDAEWWVGTVGWSLLSDKCKMVGLLAWAGQALPLWRWFQHECKSCTENRHCACSNVPVSVNGIKVQERECKCFPNPEQHQAKATESFRFAVIHGHQRQCGCWTWALTVGMEGPLHKGKSQDGMCWGAAKHNTHEMLHSQIKLLTGVKSVALTSLLLSPAPVLKFFQFVTPKSQWNCIC